MAISITTDEDYFENEDLQDAWISVLEEVVPKIDPKFISEFVINPIKEVCGLKNPFAKRKHGNRILFAVAKNVGEKVFDSDPNIMKLCLSVCHDNNYKIRRDGVKFLKEYFNLNKEQILKSKRFEDVYLPELFDFLGDEDSHIQIDAIEAFCEVIDEIPEGDEEKILDDFVPCFLLHIDLDEDKDF